MNKTLDECLEEVDRWKEAAVKRLEGLSTKQILAEYEKAGRWLEEQLGRKLPEATTKASQVQHPIK